MRSRKDKGNELVSHTCGPSAHLLGGGAPNWDIGSQGRQPRPRSRGSKQCQELPVITMLEDSGQHALVIWAQRWIPQPHSPGVNGRQWFSSEVFKKGAFSEILA